MSDISIVEVEPQLVLGMRKRGKYEEIATLLSKVFQFAVEKKAQIQGPPIFVCHELKLEDAERAQQEGNAYLEVAVPISEKIEESDEIKCYELSGGKMAKIIHKGAYQDCGPTYEKLYGWISENKKKIIGFTREVYPNDPFEVKEEDILTEIYAPID
ncbi:MAG: GyrI-like domain-containing protein [Halobacteriota archaeon]|nr:GyrI-like domain-containing protein [Halobacteriota archaeon]